MHFTEKSFKCRYRQGKFGKLRARTVQVRTASGRRAGQGQGGQPLASLASGRRAGSPKPPGIPTTV